MKASTPVNLTVNAPLTTATLQRGLNGYAGVDDTFLNSTATTIAYGASTPLYLDGGTYMPLLRFAVFQSEGGSVPNGAVIQSATLALYKGSYDYALQLNALLKPWIEAQATWLNSQTGTPWSEAGRRVRQRLRGDPRRDRGGQLQSWVDDVRRDAATAAMVERGGAELRLAPVRVRPGGRKQHRVRFERIRDRYDPAPHTHRRLCAATGKHAADGDADGPADGSSTALGGSFALTATAGTWTGPWRKWNSLRTAA